MSRILLLSPHTDDVELGCGGSVAKFIERGDEMLWLAFSVAEDSLPQGMPKDTLAREFEKVVQRYGLGEEQREILGFRVRHMPIELDTHQVYVKKEEPLKRELRSFVDAAERGERSECDGWNALENVSICAAALNSMRQYCRVMV